MGRWRPNSSIRIEGDTAYVSLTKGFEAIIDAADIPMVREHHWSVSCGKHGHAYAYRSEKGTAIMMHRVLTGASKGEYVDHVDGDGLNNKRSNIRLCTQTENMANIVSNRRNKLGVKGVAAIQGRYHAKITSQKRTIHLGTYNTPGEASAAYRGAAIALWGDFAKN